jgi:2-C-methyl-D-erythritol 4-phosphate cytidylyltransferase
MSAPVWVVLPAAGRGTRFGAPVPKQYLSVGGKLLIEHTLDALMVHPQVAGVMVVISRGDADWPGWTAHAGKPVMTCSGGAARADSVRAGLAALDGVAGDEDMVLVHDAARPNLAFNDLDALLAQRSHAVGGILAAPVRDTLKRAGDDGAIEATEPRARLWRALTPQMFRRRPLLEALDAAAAACVEVTDDAMAMERLGLRPLLVEGREDNFKVTTPADLERFAFVLAQRRGVNEGK